MAARIVPAALGGDTVGSIRVPASLCGVVGFKPTPGRWPGEGVAPISGTLDTTGLLARSVEDCELVDAILTESPVQSSNATGNLKGVKFAYAPRQYLADVDSHHLASSSMPPPVVTVICSPWLAELNRSSGVCPDRLGSKQQPDSTAAT